MTTSACPQSCRIAQAADAIAHFFQGIHLAYQYIFNSANTKLGYAREKANGGFESAPLLDGRCFGAPALAVVHGGYPYIVYNGSALGRGAN
ncbi:MAG: hypothetical protein EAZ42_04155 [Verrucomicrobia bacterium]|nr:MAG: hypothetical protein EAZ42_04155 [Verrucomicrobiota bacterium]